MIEIKVFRERIFKWSILYFSLCGICWSLYVYIIDW
jgi:hypothetical protein